MNIRVVKLLLAVVLAFLPQELQAAPDAKDSKVMVTKEANDPAFHQALLDAAKQYKSWGKIDAHQRFAPVLCAAIVPPSLMDGRPELTGLHVSASRDAGTHGRKVYFLYVKNRDDYLNRGNQSVGQTLVKESWFPKAVDDGQGSKRIEPDEKYALFIMTKLDDSTVNTDNGWVYGTVSPDGNTVTSSGRVRSCMECHQSTPNDRLFGLSSH